jgi:flagellar biosynthesis protein FlhB
LIENPPLARSLYRMVEPGQSIPFDLYAAVAGILAYLYRQKVEERKRQERHTEAMRRQAGMRVATSMQGSGGGM